MGSQPPRISCPRPTPTLLGSQWGCGSCGNCCSQPALPKASLISKPHFNLSLLPLPKSAHCLRSLSRPQLLCHFSAQMLLRPSLYFLEPSVSQRQSQLFTLLGVSPLLSSHWISIPGCSNLVQNLLLSPRASLCLRIRQCTGVPPESESQLPPCSPCSASSRQHLLHRLHQQPHLPQHTPGSCPSPLSLTATSSRVPAPISSPGPQLTAFSAPLCVHAAGLLNTLFSNSDLGDHGQVTETF